MAIVNHALARYYFGDKSPISGRFQLMGPSNSGITGAPPDQVYEIIAAMLTIAVVAAFVPARRAARVGPVEALRQ